MNCINKGLKKKKKLSYNKFNIGLIGKFYLFDLIEYIYIYIYKG